MPDADKRPTPTVDEMGGIFRTPEAPDGEDPGRIDLDRPRAPSDLRQVLETRVRRQASTYPVEQRRQDLREIIGLCSTALAFLPAPETVDVGTPAPSDG